MAVAILLFLSLPADPLRSPSAELDYSAWISFSDVQRSATSLTERDNRFVPLTEETIRSSSSFAYVWLELRNEKSEDLALVLINKGRNYHTELLCPGLPAASTLFAHGDLIPAANMVIRHHRMAFPIQVPSNGSVQLVLEYYGPKGLLIAPQFVDPSVFLNEASKERALVAFVYGAMVTLILLNILLALQFNKGLSFRLGLLVLSILFFSLRQSRMLLLVVQYYAYPEWLFPLSVAFNLFFAMFFSVQLFRDGGGYVWMFIPCRVLMAGAIVFATVSFFTAPYLMADILNLLSLPALAWALFCSIWLVAKRHRQEVLWVLISFAPWIISMVVDILWGYIGLRRSVPSEYSQALALIASLLLLSVSLVQADIAKIKRVLRHTRRDAERLHRESAEHLASLSGVRQQLRLDAVDNFFLPLETLIAGAKLLRRSFNDPQVHAGTQLILDEAATLKQQLSLVRGGPHSILNAESITDESSAELALNLAEPLAVQSPPLANVAIFTANTNNASKLGLMLRSEGYAINLFIDVYQALDAALQGRVDVLIVDPESAGQTAYSLCGLVRAEFNLLELPVLMTSRRSDHLLMQRGYAAGVNDFVSMPCEAFELTSRVQSLVRLKQVARYNQDLSRSEREKGAFLYFLTHNINTPLTILLNKVRELEGCGYCDDDPELLEDMRISVQEINDIIQNGLISFRLSDGRQTIFATRVDIQDVLDSCLHDIQRKAEVKKQSLLLTVPAVLPSVRADYSSLRGIIYNLLDNAVKFTPAGGSIELTILDEEPQKILVRDTGPGIPLEDRTRLFERFVRLSPQPTGGETSTGLGLYVARELAIMNGGALGYLDTGSGACFILELPVYSDEESRGSTISE